MNRVWEDKFGACLVLSTDMMARYVARIACCVCEAGHPPVGRRLSTCTTLAGVWKAASRCACLMRKVNHGWTQINADGKGNLNVARGARRAACGLPSGKSATRQVWKLLCRNHRKCADKVSLRSPSPLPSPPRRGGNLGRLTEFGSHCFRLPSTDARRFLQSSLETCATRRGSAFVKMLRRTSI